MNKEERNRHILPMDKSLCLVSPYCRHTMQTMVLKEGKNPRLCWDGTTHYLPSDIVMNHETPTDRKAPITFGRTKHRFLQDIWDARVMNPDKMIWLATADVNACFRFARIHANLTGAFGFLAGDYFHAAIGMVFGSTASASSWEPSCNRGTIHSIRKPSRFST